MTEQSGDVQRARNAAWNAWNKVRDEARALAGSRGIGDLLGAVEEYADLRATPPTPEQAGPSGKALTAEPSRLPRHLIESLIREHQDGTAEKDERAWRSDAVCLFQGLSASALASPGAMAERIGEARVPDGVWEALQRMIEDGLLRGAASRDDALAVARYRDRVRFLASPGAMEGAQAAQPPKLAAFVRASDDEKQQVYSRVIEKANAEQMLDWLDAQWRDGVHVEVFTANPGLTWHGLHRAATVYIGNACHRGSTIREALGNALAHPPTGEPT